MKLYRLEPQPFLPKDKNKNPWYPAADVVLGYCVIAGTEEDARLSCAEDDFKFCPIKKRNVSRKIWLDKSLARCEEIGEIKPNYENDELCRIVMRDVRVEECV